MLEHRNKLWTGWLHEVMLSSQTFVDVGCNQKLT